MGTGFNDDVSASILKSIYFIIPLSLLHFSLIFKGRFLSLLSSSVLLSRFSLLLLRCRAPVFLVDSDLVFPIRLKIFNFFVIFIVFSLPSCLPRYLSPIVVLARRFTQFIMLWSLWACPRLTPLMSWNVGLT